MTFRVLTLFPEMFSNFTQTSIFGRAVASNRVDVTVQNIRDFSTDKHKRVDDAPFGGGAGMVMTVQPLKSALFSMPMSKNSKVIYLSPKGKTLNHDLVMSLAKHDELVLVCGHYEGVDQRFIDRYVDEEISIGDYVLTGGELAAMVVMDSVSRYVTDVLSNDASVHEESFSDGLLEYPHYTRPAVYEEQGVPEVLLSGHHENIFKWRWLESIKLTKERRPDLYQAYLKKEHGSEIKKLIKKYL